MSDLFELDEEIESLDEAYDEAESDESDESDEFAEAPSRFPGFPFPVQMRPTFRTPSTANGRNLYQTRPTNYYVTQAQLQAALNRVGAQVKTNSQAISKVSAKVRAVDTAQAKQTAALKKEVGVRRKQADKLKKDLKQTRDMAALMPLLTRPKTVQLNTSVGGLTAGTKVMVDNNDSFGALMPLLLMGGLGGDSSGGMDSSMLLVLALAMSK